MKQIVFVCLGNICRSPMAEFVMKNLTDQYLVESRATSNWEHGNPIHQGTQKIFQKHQVPYDLTKTSLQIKDKDFYDFDLILGMDENNVVDLKQMAPAGTEHKIHLFASESVPDPWYTGDFDDTYRRVLAGCEAWLDQLARTEEFDR